jgi:oxygen-independent coproporphyrinogen-3 oxidase
MRLEMYNAIQDLLLVNGYRQTSMRRFVRNGLEQGAICDFDNVLALGCGGRSYLGNLHFCESFAVNQQLCKRIVDRYNQQTDYYHVTHGYILNDNEQKRRYIIKKSAFLHRHR